MSNEVEIVVKAKDKTDYGPMKAKAKAEGGKAGDEASEAFGKSTKKGSSKSGTESGKSFGGSLKKWFTGEGGGLFHEVGKSGGTVFGSGLLGALKTPILGPALIGVVGGVVATVMPAIGAIAGSGLVAGFGAGLAGLGIMFAAKSEAVQATWKRTLAQAGADMRLLSKPFESTLINIATYFRRTVDAFNPALGKAFESMAPVIDRFADRFLKSTQKLIPAIAPIASAFGAVLDSLSPAIDRMLGKLSKGLADLSRSVEKGPEGLADMVDGIGDLIVNALDLIRILNDVNTAFTTLTHGTSLVEVTMAGLNGLLAPLLVTFSALAKVLDLVNAAVGNTGKDVAGAGASMSAAANETAKLAAGLQAGGDAAKHAADPIQGIGQKAETAADKFKRQASATDALVQSLFRLQGLALTLSGAQIAFQAAVDAATASIKENGKSLNINTEKGRANKQALDAVAKSANDQTESMIRSGKGTDAAGIAAEKSKANFIRLAQQMGATKPQAEAMARSMIAIPNVSRQARLTAHKADLDAKLATAKKQLADPNLTKERRAKLNATIAALQAAIRQAKADLASVPSSKTVTITSRFITERIVRNQTTSGGGHAPGHAAGGNPPPRGKFWVGETGPELMDLSGTAASARVTPAGNSARQAQHAAQSGQSGQQTIVLELRSSGRRADDLLLQLLQGALQARGGDVVRILSGRPA